MAFSGKTVIVTGGTRGIGAEVSRNFLASGASVVLNYSSNTSAAEAFLSSLTSAQPDAKAKLVQTDLSAKAGAQSLVEQAMKAFGTKIDIVVACSGVMHMKPLKTLEEEDLDKHWGVNVKGPLFLAQAVEPHLNDNGRLVFFSTSLTRATIFQPGYLPYLASKGALEHVVRVLSRDPLFASRGINVNAVSPGPIGTDLFLEGKTEELIKTIAGFSPHNRLGTPDEVAQAVLFLAGEGGRWVSGQNLRVNGAFTV